jgi:hypothetical protein
MSIWMSFHITGVAFAISHDLSNYIERSFSSEADMYYVALFFQKIHVSR